MERMDVLSAVMDRKSLRILKLFSQNPDREYTLQEAGKASKVPLATTFRIVNKFVSLNALQRTKTKHLKVYKLAQTPEAKLLSGLLEERGSAIEEFVKRIKDLPGIRSIIQHGDDRERAQIIVIGTRETPTEPVQAAAADIKASFGYTILPLNLEQAQFQQMNSMNFFPGEKKVLFDKAVI
ncbi:MAG: hypothetical protein ABIA93_03660 [Candidatus Woesearchaeota archaeon]